MLKKNVIFYFQVFLLPLYHPKKIILSAQEHKMCQNPAYSKLNQYPLRHMKYQGPSINSREITFQRIYEKIGFFNPNFP